jgi:hypothetical protein
MNINVILLKIKQAYLNQQIPKGELLTYIKEVLKNKGFTKDDLTISVVNMIKSIIIPLSKPSTMTQDKYMKWSSSVDDKLLLWIEEFDEEIILEDFDQVMEKKDKELSKLNEDGELPVFGSMSIEEHERQQKYSSGFKRVFPNQDPNWRSKLEK